MKYILLIFSTLIALQSTAQTPETQRYIEVVGSADTLLTPTLFYYTVTVIIPDRYEGVDYEVRSTKTPADEEAYKQKTQAIVKQVKDVLLQQGVSDKDFLKSKYDVEVADGPYEFSFKLTDAKKVEALATKLAETKLCKGEVTAVFNPDIEQAKDAMRTAAFIDAKTKATKMLALNNNKPGPILQIKGISQRSTEDISTTFPMNSDYTRRFTYETPQAYSINPHLEQSINKKISVSQSMTVRFAIE